MVTMMRCAVAACVILAASAAKFNAKDQKARFDFIKLMDDAVLAEKNRLDLTQRLLTRAKPVPKTERIRNLGYDDDDANGDDGGYGNNGNDDDGNANNGNVGNYEAGLDITKFALKYVGCSAINTWSDQVAQNANAGTVFAMERFVTFRLCPKDLCGSYGRFGCDYGYGEYMVTMTDYLNIMADYHYDKFQEYCETCADCMAADEAYQDGKDAYDGNYDDDGAAFAEYGDDGAGDYEDGNGRRLADDDGYGGNAYGDENAGDDGAGGNAYGDDDAQVEEEYVPQCQYYKACQNYKSACENYENLEAGMQEDYFECTAFQSNNNIAYLGPHCNSDGRTITIGIYEDEYCADYIGENVDIEEYTGLDFNGGFSEFYSSSSCISCMNKETYDIYGDNDDQAPNDMYDLCYYLYMYSAKCNIYLSQSDESISSAQSDNEEMVCSFIESLVEGTYDQYGEVILESESFDISNWKDVHEYEKITSKVTVFQGIALGFSILLFLFMLVYSGYLHRKLTKRAMWDGSYHRSVGRSPSYGFGSRIPSGITNGRSMDGGDLSRKDAAWA